ncbi:serine/threonine-protein kinase aurora-1-like protein [Phycomyces blakesleeanus]|uniref:Aurora kinase n=1 Tax=Phycomyces blakesleeanus TaxID=4837 RepID=A0ABR3BHF1_PHYBL
MDSPEVRRHFGVNSMVMPIRDEVIKEKDANNTQTEPLLVDQSRTWKVSDFEVGNTIGTGKLGKVYVAREKKSQHVVALKSMLKKDMLEANVVQFLKREIEIHSHLNHPNILPMYGYFHDQEHVYIVLEHCTQGDLYLHLQNDGPFEEDTVAKYIGQLARALKYLHGFHIMHRDIKPENVLIDHNGQLKLADFGWAVQDKGRRATFCGTLDYLSPEMIETQIHNEKVDIWSLGVLCYELLVGTPPFEVIDSVTYTYMRIKQVDLKFPPYISLEARRFITKILVHDPSKRPSIMELENDPWLKRTSE